MLEHVREVKVVIFLDKARNPSAGNVEWSDSLSDLSLNGSLEIWQRRVLRSPWKLVISREVRLGNLWNKIGMNRIVGSDIVKEDRRRVVMERKCLEARERGSK
ncbi:hypothetical protein A2U01_0038167 [Trifolium medium]|uniref:Uncharacterized protein n=1 Tax=Trifolium medium TaxID=97028 RepID=A0A392PZY8_9FABA|nr:hypothetical protein [Trifolium medium]